MFFRQRFASSRNFPESTGPCCSYSLGFSFTQGCCLLLLSVWEEVGRCAVGCRGGPGCQTLLFTELMDHVTIAEHLLGRCRTCQCLQNRERSWDLWLTGLSWWVVGRAGLAQGDDVPFWCLLSLHPDDFFLPTRLPVVILFFVFIQLLHNFLVFLCAVRLTPLYPQHTMKQGIRWK